MKVGMKRHPDEDQVERCSLETMDARKAAKFEEHLLICETCQDRLLEMDAYVDAMRRAALVYRHQQSSGRSRTKTAVVCASGS
jgi:hypothetical protein